MEENKKENLESKIEDAIGDMDMESVEPVGEVDSLDDVKDELIGGLSGLLETMEPMAEPMDKAVIDEAEEERIKRFKDLGLDGTILKAVAKLGFVEPTEVQAKVIPKILDNEDVFVMSKTGSGKTAAFSLPIIQKVIAHPEYAGKIKALILTPTRELAVQVESDISEYAKGTGVTSTAVYGQHNMNVELKELQAGVNIIVGTPGRVFDHIENKGFSTKDIGFLVLDEADRMLDMGFYDQVVKIIKKLPRNRVTMCFSATLPYEIQNISMQYMNDPVNVDLGTDVKTVDSIEQSYYKVDRYEKRKSLVKLINYYQPESCMVFCNTRDEVDRVAGVLRQNGFYCENLHGANSQASRSKTIDAFKDGKLQILVATDVAARGIHIEDLEMVINYDVPDNKDNYIHRVGRTGRAGKKGIAINIVSSESIMTLYEIEEHVGMIIEEMDMPTDEEIKEKIAASDSVWKDKKPYVSKIDKGRKDKPYDKNKRDNRNKKKNYDKKGDGRRSGADKAKNYEKSAKGYEKQAKSYEKSAHSYEKLAKTYEKQAKTYEQNNRSKKKKTEIRYVEGVGQVEFVVKKEKKKGFVARLLGL